MDRNHVAIDVDPLLHGKVTGVARVGLSIIRALNAESDVLLIRGMNNWHLNGGNNFEWTTLESSLVSELSDFSAIREVILQLKFSRTLELLPKNIGIVYPLWRPEKKVFLREYTIVYDFSPLIFPEVHSEETVARFKTNLLFSEKYDDETILISRSTFLDSLRYANFPLSRVLLPGLGIVDLGEIKRNRDSKESKVFLYVGSIEPRKRIVEMLRWWRDSEFRGSYSLRVVGEVAWWTSASYMSEVEFLSAGLEESVSFLGYVEDRKYWEELAGAALCIYPSSYEGFGFPVLDSISVGTPVLTASNSSLVEFREAGVGHVDGQNSEDWDSVIFKVLKETPPDLEQLHSRYDWRVYRELFTN